MCPEIFITIGRIIKKKNGITDPLNYVEHEFDNRNQGTQIPFAYTISYF